MSLTVSTLLQSFAPGLEIREFPFPTLDENLEIFNCSYVINSIPVVNFTVRINKSIGSIEFKIRSTKYIAFGPQDKIKISDFITHLEILGQDLLFKYSQIIKYLHAIPCTNSLVEYVLVGKTDSPSATLQIKNDRFIFEYNQTTKYTYGSLPKLLANPLIAQFKKSNGWFW